MDEKKAEDCKENCQAEATEGSKGCSCGCEKDAPDESSPYFSAGSNDALIALKALYVREHEDNCRFYRDGFNHTCIANGYDPDKVRREFLRKFGTDQKPFKGRPNLERDKFDVKVTGGIVGDPEPDSAKPPKNFIPGTPNPNYVAGEKEAESAFKLLGLDQQDYLLGFKTMCMEHGYDPVAIAREYLLKLDYKPAPADPAKADKDKPCDKHCPKSLLDYDLNELKDLFARCKPYFDKLPDPDKAKDSEDHATSLRIWINGNEVPSCGIENIDRLIHTFMEL